MQCIYSSVSKASLQKTGVLLNSAGDFREFSPKKFENGAAGDFQQLEKPAIGGPFCSQRRKFSETRNAWLGREDSNLRMVESKSTALPLGDAPITCLESGGTIAARIPSGNARSIEGVERFQQAGTTIRPESVPGFVSL
jgi:hypothetical protein